MALLDDAWLWPEMCGCYLCYCCQLLPQGTEGEAELQPSPHITPAISSQGWAQPLHNRAWSVSDCGTAGREAATEFLLPFYSFFLKKILCAGLAHGLGTQGISEKTCCPGNMNLLAQGILQEAQKKPGSRQAETELFGSVLSCLLLWCLLSPLCQGGLDHLVLVSHSLRTWSWEGISLMLEDHVSPQPQYWKIPSS